MAKCYVYYSMHRPVSIGTYPKEGMIRFHNYENRCPINGIGEPWGYLIYNRELTLHEVCDYELKYGGETYEQDE